MFVKGLFAEATFYFWGFSRSIFLKHGRFYAIKLGWCPYAGGLVSIWAWLFSHDPTSFRQQDLFFWIWGLCTLLTEVMAIRSGLILAEKLGCIKIIIESDSMLALEGICDPNAYMGTDVPIIAEGSLMAMEFASIDFVHCSREANMVADCLAKHCFRINKSESWESNVPDFILHHYVNDLAIIWWIKSLW